MNEAKLAPAPSIHLSKRGRMKVQEGGKPGRDTSQVRSGEGGEGKR